MNNKIRSLMLLSLVALSLLVPVAAAHAQGAGFAPMVLTEEDAAKAAFMHYVQAQGSQMFPEYKLRVTEVVPRDGFFTVVIALVSTLDNVVVRNVARVVLDGTTGDVTRFYVLPAVTLKADRLFDAPTAGLDEIAGRVEALRQRESEVVAAVLADLANGHGDALDRVATFLTVLRQRDGFLLELSQPVARHVVEAVFAKAQQGELTLGRESLRLLDEINEQL